jgi:hypothetical protein
MSDGHLGETSHQQQCENSAHDITQQYGRPGNGDCKTEAEKQACADRTADRDHRHLPGIETPLQPGFSMVGRDEPRSVSPLRSLAVI